MATVVVASFCREAEIIDIEIPDGYVGRIHVDYNVRDCRTKNGFFKNVVTVGSNGRGCTSRRNSGRAAWSRFYYVDLQGRRVRELHSTGWGGGGHIWAETSTLSGSDYEFFVGTEGQYKATYEKRAP
jgi:hypothetical protein